jgi:biopolymer transport protein ExbD
MRRLLTALAILLGYLSTEAPMLRWLIALSLVAASALAQAQNEGQLLPGRIARAERDAPALFVRAREGGILQVKAREEWKNATLEEVSKLLRSFAEEQDVEMRKSGKSAYETLPGGVKVSRLFLSLDVEPTVPWQNVQWLMTVAAEQKYCKLEMSDGQRRFLAFLPTDKGVAAAPAKPPLVLKLAVHAVARKEQPTKWGQVLVTRPTEVLYMIGDQETADLQSVADFVRKGCRAVKDTPNARICGEIRAGHKVPFANVMDLMGTFETAGLTSLDFYGTAIPPAKLRGASTLPYPLKNYDTPD